MSNATHRKIVGLTFCTLIVVAVYILAPDTSILKDPQVQTAPASSLNLSPPC